MCVLACPFGHPRYNPDTKTIIKCDFCIERQEEGLEPACVSACPTGAIQVRSLDEVAQEARRRTVQSLLVSFKGASPQAETSSETDQGRAAEQPGTADN